MSYARAKLKVTGPFVAAKAEPRYKGDTNAVMTESDTFVAEVGTQRELVAVTEALNTLFKLREMLTAADSGHLLPLVAGACKKLEKCFLPELEKPYCGDCDGCGWVEGGVALKTTCSTCKGTGREP